MLSDALKPTCAISGSLPLGADVDVVMCRRTVGRIAAALNFSVPSQTMLVTAARELARNTLIHGGGGRCSWEVLDAGAKRGVRLTFEDAGPGIPDIQRAMTNGWTSGKGLGLGLPGAKRLCNEFEIQS